MNERLSQVAGKARYTTLPEVGRITISDYKRGTEQDAELLMRWGMPIPATDTIRALRDAGYKRCGRCGIYKPPDAYSQYMRKERDTVYLHTYCKHCRADMMQRKRWSAVVPLQVYPQRIG